VFDRISSALGSLSAPTLTPGGGSGAKKRKTPSSDDSCIGTATVEPPAKHHAPVVFKPWEQKDFHRRLDTVRS
jgi:hypothetical protein